MGCNGSNDRGNNQPRAQQQQMVGNPAPQHPAQRTWSQRLRDGDVPDAVNSQDFANLLPHLFNSGENDNQNLEEEDSKYSEDFKELEGEDRFEAMIRRIEMRKSNFYKKMGSKPTSDKNMSTEEKINYLREKLNVYKVSFTQGSNVIYIDREDIFYDSFTQFMNMDHQKELKIFFRGEMKYSGQDAGGMEKEWFTLLTEQFLDPETGLFRETATDEVSYVINEKSYETEDYLKKFEFFGLALAKAVFDEIPLNLCLNDLFFKLFINPNYDVTLEDIKEFDSAVYNSLKYMLENQIDEDELMEFYFQHDFDGHSYPLDQGGEERRVTDDDKEIYIILKVNFMVKNFIMTQVNAVREGFFKLIPNEAIKNFTYEELRYLCCGEDAIDIEDWKKNTIYLDDYDSTTQVIQWFWSYLEECDEDDLRSIFQFVTGISKLPAGGFNALKKNRGDQAKFCIRPVDYEDENSLPKAYTCFNRLHLPRYPEEDDLVDAFDTLLEQKEIYGFGLED
ncbi:unnamed protein product [Moneuplotes crassus]|uniref:HECT-type E3 ubiquitin transferase n=2 Tax=Euplotes crassus TaxID=5936 RepID=A0AAD1U2J2_EUPCR|nr:unnamed protein product [Moneuplotes crassus]